MKRTKRIVALFLMICMCLPVLPTVTVKAQPVSYNGVEKDRYPTSVRIDTGLSEGYSFSVAGDDIDIKNIKTNSKDLIAKWTVFGSRSDGNFEIGLYAKKEGTYTLTFDVYKNGKKNTTRKVKVYAYNLPLQVKVGDMVSRGYTQDTSGMLKVTCSEKGTTIEKIECGYPEAVDRDKNKNNYNYNSNSNIKYQTVKNNTKLKYKFGTDGGGYRSEYDGGYTERMWRYNVLDVMYIRVTLKDKYTKQLVTQVYSFYKWE